MMKDRFNPICKAVLRALIAGGSWFLSKGLWNRYPPRGDQYMNKARNEWTALKTAQHWKYELGFLKRSDLPDFAKPEGATVEERLQHRWAKLCEPNDGPYKAYTLTPHQTARVEYMLYGLEKMTDIALKLAEEVARLKQELAQGPQATVDDLIAYLDPDSDKRKH